MAINRPTNQPTRQPIQPNNQPTNQLNQPSTQLKVECSPIQHKQNICGKNDEH